jgi:hypothetical protein
MELSIFRLPSLLYEGGHKIPGIVKKIYLKYSYKFETLVTFELLPLQLDAVIPVPLPLLETLSKIFQQKCCQGPPTILLEPLRQQKPPFWLKIKWWLCSTPPLLA